VTFRAIFKEGEPVRHVVALLIALTALAAGPAGAQAPIEDELVLQTPVSKFVVDAALKAFADYAKEKWGVTVKTNAQYAGTPVSYGRIVEWKGRPEADIFWGGESALFDKLAEQKLLVKHEVAKELVDAIPAGLGKPKPIPLKDPNGYWIGTALEPYGLVYHPRLVRRLGVPEPKDWEDLLHPKLKGNVARAGAISRAGTGSSGSAATPGSSRRGAVTCPRSWRRASSRPASRCRPTWRSRRSWRAST
jgi:hypothetical protein